MRIMKPVKDRRSISAGTLYQIRARIESIARNYDCSKSFVINTLLADALNVDLEDRYDAIGTRKRTTK